MRGYCTHLWRYESVVSRIDCNIARCTSYLLTGLRVYARARVCVCAASGSDVDAAGIGLSGVDMHLSQTNNGRAAAASSRD